MNFRGDFGCARALRTYSWPKYKRVLVARVILPIPHLRARLFNRVVLKMGGKTRQPHQGNPHNFPINGTKCLPNFLLVFVTGRGRTCCALRPPMQGPEKDQLRSSCSLGRYSNLARTAPTFVP